MTTISGVLTAKGCCGHYGSVADHLNELLEGFALHQRRRSLSPRTIEVRRWRMAAFEEWLAGAQPDLPTPRVLHASSADVELFLDGTPLTAASRSTYLSWMSSFYRWAIRDGFTTTNPISTIERPRTPRRLPRPLASGDLIAALRYADARTRAWLCLGAYQGFRCVEMARLVAADIDLSRLTVLARGKGDKDRTLPLHTETLAALLAYGIPRHGPVFLRKDNGHGSRPPKAIRPSTISHHLSVYLDGLGTAHQLRHWFASEVYDRSGGDILLTQQFMGHSDPSTTAIYAAVSTKKGRAVIADLGR